MRQLGLVGLCGLVLSGMAGMAQAQSSYVRGALDRLDAVADGNSYGSNLHFDVNRVTAGEHFHRSFLATSGNAVRVTATCDNDCNLMQLRVLDFRDREIASGQLDAGASTLLFYPQPGQTYWVYAQPMDCGEAYCYVVLGIWQ